MKKYKLVILENIYIKEKNELYDAFGVKALEGFYWESPIHVFDDSISETEIASQLMDKYDDVRRPDDCRFELRYLL